ncbi:MAG: phage major capsid protein, partial [Cetobacterium sp.]
IVSGNGVAPNISGMLNSGNFTPHGFAAAALGGVLPKLVLARRMIAQTAAAGYPADAIVMGPMEWADVEIEQMTTSAGQARFTVDADGNLRLFGRRVVECMSMPADTLAVGRFSMAYTVHNRQGVVVELSEHDGDNFRLNLVTVRAERRLALTCERPAAVRAGDLTPA